MQRVGRKKTENEEVEEAVKKGIIINVLELVEVVTRETQLYRSDLKQKQH